MLIQLAPNRPGSGKPLRYQPPPCRDRDFSHGAQADTVYLSSPAEQAREKGSSLDLSRSLKLGILTSLSLVGGLSGVASAQELVLEQPLIRAPDPSALVDPSVSKGTGERLARSISVLGPETIQALLDSGLTIKMANGLDGLLESGALVLRAPETFRQTAPADALALNQTLSYPMGSTVLEQRVQELTEGRWRVFRQQSDKSKEITVADMAREHGFRSSEDIAWFSQQVEVANTERLTAARQNALNKARYESTLKGRKARKASERLEQYERDPGQIPFRHDYNPMVVPDYHRFQLFGKTYHGTLHDTRTLDLWRDPDRKLGGQYFGEGDQHLILMTNAGVNNDQTIVHEIGHALERMAQRNSPEEFAAFRSRLSRAHDGINPSGKGRELDPDGGKHHDQLDRKQISDYSRTNSREYLAEGFAHYFQDAEKLRKDDPLLHGLVEELLRLAIPAD